MAFHIIFATLGVGVPFMVVFAEVLYQVTKNDHYAILAKRWTKGFAIILGVAIPSGTLVGVMLSLLFPGFMEIVGQVIALPFQVEIWAFLLEALFMSIYVCRRSPVACHAHRQRVFRSARRERIGHPYNRRPRVDEYAPRLRSG